MVNHQRLWHCLSHTNGIPTGAGSSQDNFLAQVQGFKRLAPRHDPEIHPWGWAVANNVVNRNDKQYLETNILQKFYIIPKIQNKGMSWLWGIFNKKISTWQGIILIVSTSYCIPTFFHCGIFRKLPIWNFYLNITLYYAYFLEIYFCHNFLSISSCL